MKAFIALAVLFLGCGAAAAPKKATAPAPKKTPSQVYTALMDEAINLNNAYMYDYVKFKRLLSQCEPGNMKCLVDAVTFIKMSFKKMHGAVMKARQATDFFVAYCSKEDTAQISYADCNKMYKVYGGINDTLEKTWHDMVVMIKRMDEEIAKSIQKTKSGIPISFARPL